MLQLPSSSSFSPALTTPTKAHTLTTHPKPPKPHNAQMPLIDLSPTRARAARERGLQTPMDDIRILGIHLKHSLKYRFGKKPKGMEYYDEAAEQAKFAKGCTHHHGSMQHNLPRQSAEEEQGSELASRSESKKVVKVHFADEEGQRSMGSLQAKTIPPDEEVEGLMRRWLDPGDEAEPGECFEHACPVARSYVLDIMRGERLNDGVNDWVTRAAALKEIDNARLPLVEASRLDGSMLRDVQALGVLYGIVEGMEAFGWPVGEAAEGSRW